MKTLFAVLFLICTGASAFADSNCVIAVDDRNAIPNEFNELFSKSGYEIAYLTSVEICSENGSCRRSYFNPDMSPASYGFQFEFNHVSNRQDGPIQKTEIVFTDSRQHVLYSRSKRGYEEAQDFIGDFSNALKMCK